MKKELKAPALKHTLGYRVAYSEALARGLSGDEWTDRNAKEELQQLMAEVEKLLKQ